MTEKSRQVYKSALCQGGTRLPSYWPLMPPQLRSTHLGLQVSCSAEPCPNFMITNRVNGSYFKPPSVGMFVTQQWMTGWFLMVPLAAVWKRTTKGQGHMCKIAAEAERGSG